MVAVLNSGDELQTPAYEQGEGEEMDDVEEKRR